MKWSTWKNFQTRNSTSSKISSGGFARKRKTPEPISGTSNPNRTRPFINFSAPLGRAFQIFFRKRRLIRSRDACPNEFVAARAELENFAARAVGFASVATPPAVPDQPVTPDRPIFLRHEFNQLLLDLFRVFLFRQAKTLRKTDHVRIDDDALVDSKRVSQNNICRLAADAGQFAEFFH